MPLPKRLARFNRVVTNPLVRHVAGRLPGFAIVTHRGRRSGRVHRTPVNLFRSGERYVLALTYGRDSQWVRNVLAAGEADVETRGERVHLVDPEVIHDPSRALVPAPVRPILHALNVSDFMVLGAASASPIPIEVPMPHEPSLIVRIRQGSRVERQLRDDPPALVRGDSVSLDPVTAPSSGSGVLEPPSPGQVVYALPSPEGLVREREELRHAISGAPHGPEPLVIVIEAANELRDDELEAAVHAADTTSRAVILTILRDG